MSLWLLVCVIICLGKYVCVFIWPVCVSGRMYLYNYMYGIDDIWLYVFNKCSMVCFCVFVSICNSVSMCLITYVCACIYLLNSVCILECTWMKVFVNIWLCISVPWNVSVWRISVPKLLRVCGRVSVCLCVYVILFVCATACLLL